MRPREEWQIVERPDLRIVDDEAWHAVRDRMDSPRKRGGQRGRGPAPRTLFGGLLRCGVCGGAMVAVHKRYYGCAAHKDRGPAVCAGTFAPRQETDRRLIAELRQQVLAPEAIAKIRTRVRELLQDLQRRGNSDAEARAARIEALQGEISRLTDAVAQMGLSAALRARLAAAEAELAALAATGSAHPTSIVPSADKVGARIREVAMRLESALATDVDMRPQDPGGQARRHRRRGEATTASTPKWTSAPYCWRQPGPMLLGVVAGEGFEPSTFGL